MISEQDLMLDQNVPDEIPGDNFNPWSYCCLYILSFSGI